MEKTLEDDETDDENNHLSDRERYERKRRQEAEMTA